MNFHCDKCGKIRRDHFHRDQHDIHDFHHNFHDIDHHDHDHHNHHHDHHHFNDHHCDDFHRRDFICDRFLCDDDFRFRLGGLKGNLNFRLRQLIGCIVKFKLENGKKIIAKVCFVGSDFVELEQLFEERDDFEDLDERDRKRIRRIRRKRKLIRKKIECAKIVILPFEAIHLIELEDDCDLDVSCKCHH